MSSKEKKNNHIRNFLVLFTVLIITFFAPYEWIQKTSSGEQKAVKIMFGKHYAKELKTSADAAYTKIFYNSGLIDITYDYFFSQWKGDEGNEALKLGWLDRFIEKRLDGIWWYVYIMTYRTFVLLAWFPLFFSLLIPLLVDAIFTRKIRQTKFTFASPFQYSLSRKYMVYLVTAFIFFVVTPLSLMALSLATFMPVIILFSGISTWLIIANLPKRV